MKAAALLLLASLGWGVVVDRLAVRVGEEIITEQQILLYLRTAAILNGAAFEDSGATRKRAAQKLIEITLIRIEMQTNRYPLPDDAAISSALSSVKTQRFAGDNGKYQGALKQYGISESELKDSLKWQLAILSFIEFRFRPGVQIPEEEMRDYYQYDYKKEGGKKTTYNMARPEILEILTQQRIDNLLDRWLNLSETSTKVRWVDAVFGGKLQ